MESDQFHGMNAADSWYTRFRNVLLQVLAAVLNVLCQDYGRKSRSHTNPSFILNHLYAYPNVKPTSDAHTSDRPIPEKFPILDLEIPYWRSYFEKAGLIETLGLHLPPGHRSRLEEGGEDDDKDQEWNDEVPSTAAEDARRYSSAVTKGIRSSVLESLSEVYLHCLAFPFRYG